MDLTVYLDINNGFKCNEFGFSKQATAELTNQIVYNECMDRYNKMMQSEIKNINSLSKQYDFHKARLMNIHARIKDEIMNKVEATKFKP